MKPAYSYRLFLFCFLLCCLRCIPLHASDSEIAGNSESLKSFADTLFNQGHLYRATMEYERFLYFYPEDPAVPEIRSKITAAAQTVGNQANTPEYRTLSGKKEKSPLGFANYLFERGHYYQAITEYERFIYYNPDHPLVLQIRLKIAFCYKLGEQYTKAAELFNQLADDYRNTEIGIEAEYNIGECLRLHGDYEHALVTFDTFIEHHPQHHSLTSLLFLYRLLRLFRHTCTGIPSWLLLL